MIYCINDKKDLSLFESLNNTIIMLKYAQMSKIKKEIEYQDQIEKQEIGKRIKSHIQHKLILMLDIQIHQIAKFHN